MQGARDPSQEGLAIIRAADEAGLMIRLAGSTAFAVHAPSAGALYARLGRQILDVDLVAASKVKADQIDKLMQSLGYAALSHHNVWHGETRQMYERPGGAHVDVFREELDFCHPISLKGRLGLDHPTIPLPELLLQKLQIVEINEKDLQDAAILLLDHQLGKETDELDGELVGSILARDWGFWYTATTNLRKVREWVERSPLEPDQQERVLSRIGDLEQRIERAPKSSRWKIRARIGTKKRWYQEVEEAHR